MGQQTRNVDIVFCIDGTGSMFPIMDNVKAKAKQFNDDLRNAIVELGSDVGSVRVKLIIFRDYGVDEVPMDISNWYELPDDDDLFSERLNGISPSGGGDIPENGLEALYYALKSDFVNGPSDRQVIVMITDAEALDMGVRATSPKYPTDMGNLADLSAIWMGMVQDPNLKLAQHNKRLLMFAPAGTKYEDLASVLEGSMFRPVDPGRGLADVEFGDIVKIIAASVGTK